jgi:alpha-L-rhamnosidase
MKQTNNRIAGILILFLIFSSGLMAKELSINPDLMQKPWEAQWISCPGKPSQGFGVFHFRKNLTLSSKPAQFIIHVSGDNRYELFINGARAVSGPARGDLNHWRFESLDIAPLLQAGKNQLAAVVWNYSDQAPMAQMTYQTAFLLQGDTSAESLANTNESWKVTANGAIQLIPVSMEKLLGYYAAGPGEEVHATQYPWGWEKNDFDDSQWVKAQPIGQAAPRAIQDTRSRWFLVPRNIPLMEEKPEHFTRVVRSSGVSIPNEFLQGQKEVAIPANSRLSILLDQSYLTTAYPELKVTGGKGAKITLTYAEALWKDGKKGNRDETEGRSILGYEDRFFPDGGEHRLFRPLWWRTYRYVQLEIETNSSPLTLENLQGIFTGYPFQLQARFDSDDPDLSKIWEVGWRTARLCAHETYMDCPYYEQLQYGGDTRLQSLVSLYMTGDSRLVKNAINQLDDSRIPDGITQSRYPSELPQFIPPFSLIWVGMLHDLWWYHGEADFVRSHLNGAAQVLQWFETRLNPNGLLGKLEWWNFVDWTEPFQDGVPPQEADGQSAILSLQLAAALQEAAELERRLGSTERAAHYQMLSTRIVKATGTSCWDPTRLLLADTPTRRSFSQQGNALAVLLDAIPKPQQVQALKTILTDPSVTQASYYFRFYLFKAMKKAGIADQYLEQLKPWRTMLDLGLTTWAENPEPTRSDCHAWSSHPNFDLLATVAGIEPAAPGFSKVRITPHPGNLKSIKALLPHAQGDLKVEYYLKDGKWHFQIELPGKLEGTFIWQQQEKALHPGRQELIF